MVTDLKDTAGKPLYINNNMLKLFLRNKGGLTLIYLIYFYQSNYFLSFLRSLL